MGLTKFTKFPTSYWAMGHLSSSLLQDLRQRGPRLHHHRDAQRTHRRAARTPYRLDSRLYFLFMLLDPFDSIFCLFALYLSLRIYVYIYLFIIIYINILFISLTSLCGRRRAWRHPRGTGRGRQRLHGLWRVLRDDDDQARVERERERWRPYFCQAQATKQKCCLLWRENILRPLWPPF